MKKALSIFIGFVHDLATGCWGATVLAVAWLHHEALVRPEVSAVLLGLGRRFFWLGLACTAVVFATGAGRTFTYAAGVYGTETEGKRKKMLLVKHAVLAVVFGMGFTWQYIMLF